MRQLSVRVVLVLHDAAEIVGDLHQLTGRIAQFGTVLQQGVLSGDGIQIDAAGTVHRIRHIRGGEAAAGRRNLPALQPEIVVGIRGPERCIAAEVRQ